MIKIVNKRTHVPTTMDFYIGRGSVMGNPYTHRAADINPRKAGAKYLVNTHDEAIDKYEKWLIYRLADKSSEQSHEFYRLLRFARQHDIYLVCYCAPRRCEGDIIKQEIEKLLFDG